MFLSDPAASRAKTLVDQAQQTQVLSPTAAAELASLLASLDAAPLSALLPSILASPLVPDLQRCGIEAAATRLLSTQQTAQTIHACFAGIVDALDRIERALEDSPDSGAPLLHLARTCVEKLAQCVERQQQSAVLWEDPSAAPSLVKASDCSVRMLTRCAGFKLRHDKHVAETCVRITKAAARTVDLIAALFKSVAGVAEGRQQWLQQYANHVLERHRAMLAMPQQFKSTWDALCAISEVSGPELCLRVYMQSCDSVRSLANQTTLQLQRISAEEFADAKVQRKLKGPLAFIRYLVFQLPALVARVLAADRAVHWDKLVKAAMGMLDAVFGKLATPDSLARTPEGIEADVRKLAVVVCDKFVLALLAHSTQPLTQHLDDLDAFLRHPGHKCLQLPLLKGLIQPAAHRAVLRVVVESISSFSASQQQELMQSGRPTIVQALVLAIDRDPASLFSHNSKGPTAVSSAGSLGARAAVDAWIATSEHSMSHILAQSTIEGILDVVAGDTIRIDDTNRARLGRLLGGMMKTLSIR
ncbi:hypothetical protein LPJ53_000034 [Coemansia erecta]|uniref:Uncharacterized protein n=1 Tax=Coemansia erecta TaxID=147472 RepID=A0A9W8CW19_9FUNG|nr:hypothetical protein LPJ53_000034 [Coemansia erecta]